MGIPDNCAANTVVIKGMLFPFVFMVIILVYCRTCKSGSFRIFFHGKNKTGKEIAVATVEGTADVILEGKFKNVVVQSPNITVYAQNTEIENVEINGTRSKVIVGEDSDIENVVVRAANVVIEGKGTVEEVEVKAGGSGTVITTPDTQINVDRGANDVVGTGEVEIKPNETYVNGKTETHDAKPLVQPSTGGSSGGTVTTYTVNYSVVGNNGTLTGTVASGSSVNSGTSVTFTATPSTGYEIKEWKVNGVVVESGNTLTRTVSANTTVTVEFKAIEVAPTTYTLTYSVIGEGGTLTATVESGSSVAPNTLVTFTATPSLGYEVKEWRVDGEITGNLVNPETTIERRISQDATVTVEFVRTESYTITYSVIGTGGTLTAEVSNATEVVPGSTISYTAYPSEGYRVKEWKVNGVVVEGLTGNSYWGEETYRDIHVTVEFELIPPTMYTVNFSRVGTVGELYASVEGVGHIYDGNQVAEGTDITFTADIPSGYEIKEWKYNGYVIVVEGNSLTISDIGMDTTVTVELSAIPIYEATIQVINVSGATVTLRDSYNNPRLVTETIAGSIFIYNLEAGDYTVTIEKDGYYTEVRTLDLPTVTYIDVTMAEVIPGIVTVNNPPIIELNVGQDLPTLPSTVDVVLDTEEVISLGVVWNADGFDKNSPENYVLGGTLTLIEGVENPLGLVALQLVDVFAAPEVTLDITNSSVLRFDFDVPVVWVGETALADINTLYLLRELFNDPTLDYTILNEENINKNVGPYFLEIELMDDAINGDLFWELDHPEGLYGGNGDGVYRKDVSVDLSVFNNHLGLASESTAEPFKMKFSVPYEYGIPNYDAPISGVWQTAEQRALEIDPIPDSIPPEFVSITPATGGEIWLSKGDNFTFTITASDDNLYRFTPSPTHDMWYYAMEDPYNGNEDMRSADQVEGLTVTYADGTWEFSFDSVDFPIGLFAEFEDYAGNRLSDRPEYADETNRFFDFGVRFLDKTALDTKMEEVSLLDYNDYSFDTWEDVEAAMMMSESTQTEVDEKVAALTTAVENLYEKLLPVADVYTVESNSVNNEFYVLENDKGTGRNLLSMTLASNGTALMFAPDRIEYTPNPGFVGTDSFGYVVKTLRETSPSNVFVYIEPVGSYIRSGFADDGTEYGFYSDEGGLKVIIEDKNTIELHIEDSVPEFTLKEGADSVTIQYLIGDDLYSKVIGKQVNTLVEPVVISSVMTTPVQGLEIEDVEGIGLNEIEVGKTYYVKFNKVPTDSTDVVVHNWSVVSGNATINHSGELVANSPGEIVLRVESTNSEVPYVFDEITLNAFNMYFVQAYVGGGSYGTIEMSIDGLPIENLSRVKEGSLLVATVTPQDETIEVTEWHIDGVPTPITDFETSVIVSRNRHLVAMLFKPNSTPVANDDSEEVTSGSTTLIDVLANDTDSDGDTLEITGFTQGTNGTVTQEGDSLRYSPNAGFIGVDEFEYDISDGNGGTDSALVSVIVNPSGTKLGTGSYQGNDISFYMGDTGLIAVLDGQVSTVGDVVAENYTSVVDIVSMDNSVALIYIWEGNIEVSRVVAIGQNAVESEHAVVQAYGVISGIEYTVADDETIHFTYLDSQGSPDSYNKPDLMYSNTFDEAEILVQRAYQDLSSSGSWGADYIESGYTISVDNEGDPVVAYIRRNIWKWSNGSDTNFYLHIENPLTQENITVESNYKTNIYSNLELIGGGSTIGFSYDRSGVTISGTVTADPLSVDLP